MKINTISFLFITFFYSLTSFAQEKLDVFEVARKGTAQQALEIIKTDEKAFNTTNNNGFTPLILACYRGNNEVAKVLIENNCDLNAKSEMGTPLMAAIVKGNNEIAKLLIEKKADINYADINGTTALIYAVQFQNIEILKLLIENNVNKLHKDNDGKTAFEHAVFSSNDAIIKLLK
ncbi:MAG: ankyrin repeat domain-containing protein [Flavobacteriaceae bacterium]|nr:MAG: ankyrin repeat domain-containing protein [Flavobacteriaceae bacterium]